MTYRKYFYLLSLILFTQNNNILDDYNKNLSHFLTTDDLKLKNFIIEKLLDLINAHNLKTTLRLELIKITIKKFLKTTIEV